MDLEQESSAVITAKQDLESRGHLVITHCSFNSTNRVYYVFPAGNGKSIGPMSGDELVDFEFRKHASYNDLYLN